MLPSFRRSIFQLPRSRPSSFILRNVISSPSRHLSTPPTQTSISASRIDSITAKFPKSLRPYATHFLNRPASHITSFLILHEITAVVPLAGFFYLFHTTSWTPADLLPKEWIDSGLEKFTRYVNHKGWSGWVDGRVLMELATSYAVVKALIPVRILFSLWAAPWFARLFIIPIVKGFGKLRPPTGPPAK